MRQQRHTVSNATAARLSGVLMLAIPARAARRGATTTTWSSERHGEMTIYQLTDRLHDGRTVRVQADQVAATVASWLAELDACSPLAELLGQAVCDGDWPAIHGIADYLSVEVEVAA